MLLIQHCVEMNTSIQKPTTCKLYSVVKFFSTEATEIHYQLPKVYDDVMTRQIMNKWVCEFIERKTEVRDKQRNGCLSVRSDKVLQRFEKIYKD